MLGGVCQALCAEGNEDMENPPNASERGLDLLIMIMIMITGRPKECY